jgi:hypothetical protein
MRMPYLRSGSVRSLLFLLLWVFAIWGGMHAIRGYWEPDEARFVYVAREMVASGDWLVPHRHGELYAHKPPLMFWLINLGESILPIPFGSRLPSFLGVLLALASVYGIAKLWGGRTLALRTVAVLSGSLLFWQTGGMGQIDALLLGLESAALYLLLRNDRLHPNRLPWGAFLLMGLAILAKGPVGLLIPLGVYLSLRAATRQGTGPRTCPGLLTLGVVLSLAVPLTWLFACWRSGAPESYLRELIFTQNVSRAAGELGHRQPFFYYLLHLPVGFLPWTLFVPAAFVRLRKSDPALLRKLVVWAAFVVVFFSIPSSKRNLYILPAMPALALMIAAAWDDLIPSTSCRKTAMAVVAALAVGGAGAALAVLLHDEIPALATNGKAAFALGALSVWPWAILAATAAGAAWILRKPGTLWLERFAASVCIVFAVCGWAVFTDFDAIKVPRAIIPLAAQHIPEGGRLLLYNVNGETLALHAGRTGLRCVDDASMLRAMASQGRGLAVFSARDGVDLTKRFPCTVEAGTFRMGSKLFAWCAFDVDASNRDHGPTPSVR